MLIPLLFYLFSAITIAAGIGVISAKNSVHAVLLLILAFFNAAGLFVLLGAEFLAMVLVIVYVGAVAVLFLFVVMMLDINYAELRAGFLRYLPLGLLVAVFLLTELFFILKFSIEKTHLGAAHAVEANLTNTEVIGMVLYTDYFLPFQVAGLILLVAMIGAIVLTLQHRGDVKRQNVSHQLSRSPKSSIEIIKVESGKGIDTVIKGSMRCVG